MTSQTFVQSVTQLGAAVKACNEKNELWTKGSTTDVSVYEMIKTQLKHLAQLYNLDVFDFYENPVLLTELGLVVKLDPKNYVIEVEGSDVIAKKIAGRLSIRLNRTGDIEFVATSPYFNEKDGLRISKHLVPPVPPGNYEHAILPKIVIDWANFVTHWETADLQQREGENL